MDSYGLQGNIAMDYQYKQDIGGMGNQDSSIYEPVSETIKRDLFGIWTKCRYVLLPQVRHENAKALRD